MYTTEVSHFGILSERYGGENAFLIGEFINAYKHLLASSPFDKHKPAKLYGRLERALVFNLRATIAKYSTLADEILRTCVDTSEHTVTGEFLEEMADTPVFREYLHFYKTGDALVLKFLLSFLYFGKKIDLDFRDLEPLAFRDWLQIEDELEKLRFEPKELILLKRVVESLLDSSTFDDSVLLPKHGSGQVAEGVKSGAEKFDHLTLDSKLRQCFRKNRFGLDRYADRVAESKGDATNPKRSRFFLVPKTYKSYRSIMMEPAAYMYFQQEVMRWLVSCMEDSPIGDLVDLKDQRMNREYALYGSIHKTIDTIDLSAASDRVHVDLVRAVFPRKILYYLLGTRSNEALLPNGETRRLNKFAPMGSALCFPVQCILFSAITTVGYLMTAEACTLDELVSRDLSVDAITRMRKSWTRRYQDYSRQLISPRVYGDDIACDTRTTGNVTFLLDRYGLKVNTSKSFIGGQSVRESCGIYAFNGEDITPFLYRVKRFSRNINVATYASWIESINNAGDHGYRGLQSYMISRLRAVAPLPKGTGLPFTESRDQFGIYTKQKLAPLTTRPHKGKRGQDWQLEEEKVLLITPRGRVVITDDSYLYNQWMRSKVRGGSIDAIAASTPRITPRHMRFSAGWTPLRI